MKEEKKLELTEGSEYKIYSLGSRESMIETEGTFKGFISIGVDETGLLIELNHTHGEMAGKTRIVPLHVLLAIDILKIEQNEKKIGKLEGENYLYIVGDAASERILLKAGLVTARGLVTAISSDADNVFITLTAKELRPDVFILSRAADLRNEKKLLRAGATRVVSPYSMGGSRMAQILKKPTVIDFLDTALKSRDLDLKIEELVFPEHSYLVGKTILESNLRRDFGVIILAIKKSDSAMVFNPGPHEMIEAGDLLITIGKKRDVMRMAEAIAGDRMPAGS